MEKLWTRREGILMTASLGAAAIISPAQAVEGMEKVRSFTRRPASAEPPLMAEFSKDNEFENAKFHAGVHEGKGEINVKFFPFSGATHPANFLIYDMPPGSSEGVHVHTRENENNEGSFDEYYYIISGAGQMEIGDKIVAVKAGDHLHTPLYIPHGIENTSKEENLRVFLTFITR